MISKNSSSPQMSEQSKKAPKPSTLRIGKRYRPTRVDNNYDAIVIGSGIGGMTTAAILSKAGKKVLVLEQHYTAGGYTHSYSRNGYEWDVGVHYIGDMGAKTQARQMFDFISADKLKWAPMDDEYDRFYIGDKVFSAMAGKKKFRENLINRFPTEKAAVDGYMKLLDAVGKEPILSLGLRLGEGSGGALAIGVLKAAVACHSGMATFAEAGVSGA